MAEEANTANNEFSADIKAMEQLAAQYAEEFALLKALEIEKQKQNKPLESAATSEVKATRSSPRNKGKSAQKEPIVAGKKRSKKCSDLDNIRASGRSGKSKGSRKKRLKTKLSPQNSKLYSDEEENSKGNDRDEEDEAAMSEQESSQGSKNKKTRGKNKVKRKLRPQGVRRIRYEDQIQEYSKSFEEYKMAKEAALNRIPQTESVQHSPTVALVVSPSAIQLQRQEEGDKETPVNGALDDPKGKGIAIEVDTIAADVQPRAPSEIAGTSRQPAFTPLVPFGNNRSIKTVEVASQEMEDPEGEKSKPIGAARRPKVRQQWVPKKSQTSLGVVGSLPNPQVVGTASCAKMEGAKVEVTLMTSKTEGHILQTSMPHTSSQAGKIETGEETTLNGNVATPMGNVQITGKLRAEK